jgi:hypothetical protein
VRGRCRGWRGGWDRLLKRNEIESPAGLIRQLDIERYSSLQHNGEQRHRWLEGLEVVPLGAGLRRGRLPQARPVSRRRAVRSSVAAANVERPTTRHRAARRLTETAPDGESSGRRESRMMHRCSASADGLFLITDGPGWCRSEDGPECERHDTRRRPSSSGRACVHRDQRRWPHRREDHGRRNRRAPMDRRPRAAARVRLYRRRPEPQSAESTCSPTGCTSAPAISPRRRKG